MKQVKKLGLKQSTKKESSIEELRARHVIFKILVKIKKIYGYEI